MLTLVHEPLIHCMTIRLLGIDSDIGSGVRDNLPSGSGISLFHAFHGLLGIGAVLQGLDDLSIFLDGVGPASIAKTLGASKSGRTLDRPIKDVPILIPNEVPLRSLSLNLVITHSQGAVTRFLHILIGSRNIPTLYPIGGRHIPPDTHVIDEGLESCGAMVPRGTLDITLSDSTILLSHIQHFFVLALTVTNFPSKKRTSAILLRGSCGIPPSLKSAH